MLVILHNMWWFLFVHRIVFIVCSAYQLSKLCILMYSFLSACKGSKNFVTSYNIKQSFIGYNAVSPYRKQQKNDEKSLRKWKNTCLLKRTKISLVKHNISTTCSDLMSDYDRWKKCRMSDYDRFLSDYDRWFCAVRP